MVKKIICVLSAVIIISFSCINVFADETPDLSALSAVLLCKETGDVIFEKNSSQLLSMASTTKIMTSVIALECNTPEREVEITSEMVNVEGTSSGLKTGDKITLINLVYCMLLESGNDAANAVAISIAGSLSDFSLLMNNKAKEIGMENTSFVTPSGLDDENHYTTAYDMALLTSYALDNNEFAQICAKTSYTVSFINSDKQIKLYNHNRLLKEYENCIGVKTGFTKKSGRCLVSASKREGVTLIAVTLNDGDDWNDHKKMLDYGYECMTVSEVDNDFSKYKVAVVGSDVKNIGISCYECNLPYLIENGLNIEKKVYLEKFLYAPVKKGDIVGFVKYYNNGRLVMTQKLTAASSAETVKKEKSNLSDRFFGLFDRW